MLILQCTFLDFKKSTQMTSNRYRLNCKQVAEVIKCIYIKIAILNYQPGPATYCSPGLNKPLVESGYLALLDLFSQAELEAVLAGLHLLERFLAH